MADAVSKLYAEFGFKVNEEGLKKAQGFLKDLAAQMTAMNNATKNAAREYGIFSKDKAKQMLEEEKLATQKAKTERELNKKEIDNKNFYYKNLKTFYKLFTDEKRRDVKENDSLNKESMRSDEKTQKSRLQSMKKYLKEHRLLTRSLKKVWKFGIGGSLGGAMADALSSSIPIRDLLLQTGLGFSGTQNIARRFANIGILKSQENVLSDLQAIQQNIVDISMGAKGKTFPYKMLGAYAQKGNILGMVNEMGNLIKDLKPEDAVNLLKKMGFGGEWYSYFRLRERGGGLRNRLSERGQAELVDAETSLVQLRYAFQETAKMLTAQLNPVITKITDSLVKAFDEVIDKFKNKNKEISEAFEKIGKSLVSFIDSIEWENLPDLLSASIDGFVATMEKLGAIIDWIADKIGISTPEERLRDKYREKYIKSRARNISEALDINDKEGWWFEQRKGESYGEYKKRLETKNPLYGMSNGWEDAVNKFNRARPYSLPITNNVTNSPVVTINGVEQHNIADVSGKVINETTRASLSNDYIFAKTFLEGQTRTNNSPSLGGFSQGGNYGR